MKNRCSFIVFMCLQLIVTISRPAEAGDPSAGELIDLAPMIRSSDKRLRSIDMGGYIKHADGVIALKFRAIYRAPNRHALIISDGVDDTPLLWASDDKAIIYDPVRPAVFFSAYTQADFIMRTKGNTFEFAWDCRKDKKNPSSILFDVKSLFINPSKGDEVVKTGDGRYRLTRTTTKGSFLVSHIDTSLKQPYTRIEIIRDVNSGPALCVDRIVIDGTLGDEEFTFPERAQLAAKIGVRDWPGDGEMKDIDGLASMFRASYARLVANRPDLRDAADFPGLSGINWDDVKINDKRFSKILRDLIPEKPQAPND